MSSKSTFILQNLNQLPLRPSSLATLLRRGFETTQDVESSASESIANFASELGVTLAEASSIRNEVLSLIAPETSEDQSRIDSSSRAETVASLMEKGVGNRNLSIVSFCQGIDKMLGGGFALSEVTEIVGVPGVGKTQLVMQLCVDVTIPRENGGVAGEAIYIDSEGSFVPERLLVMAEALVSHVQLSTKRRRERSRNQNQPLFVEVPVDFTPENILDSVHLFRVHDEAAQTATIYSLPEFITERNKLGKPPIKLIVIDSIAFHYRCQLTSKTTSFSSRTRSLTKIAAFLTDLATRFEIAVVVINQMTTKIGGGLNDAPHSDQTRIMPALGESWAHCTTTRLLLSNYKDNIRKCTLVKSPHKPSGCAFYTVNEIGVREAKLAHDETPIDKRARTD